MRAVSTVASGLRHSAVAIAEALLVAAIVAALLLALSPVYQPADFLAGTESAQAAKPSSGHISVPDGVYAGTTTATVNPGGDVWVVASCWQDSTLVYRQYVRVNADNQAMLTLGPTPSWSGGSANCTAEEGYWFKGSRWRTLASTTFAVSG